jgi:fatty acid-binding protein DegV
MGQRHRERSIERYCLVHAHAEARALSYAEQLEACLGFPPAYTMEIAPVIGVHNGTGAVAVAYVQD